MNDQLKTALNDLDTVIHRARDDRDSFSKQPRFTTPQHFFASMLTWARRADLEEPKYATDSRKRDKWLRDFWRKEPHMAGVVNSVVAIDKNRSWIMTGGRNQVARYTDVLRAAENGHGWRTFMSLQSQSFYTTDMGAVTETGRDGEAGPLRGLYHVDPGKCRLTGDPDLPLEYDDSDEPWGIYDFFRSTSLPSTADEYLGLGYCAVSRALELTKLMIAIYQHDQEQINVRAPRGLLLLQNISQSQWDEAMQAREANLDARMQEWFGGVAVLAQMGVDQIDAKLVALSQLPENFDLKVFTDLLMYAYALCFGYDPIEFWPVLAGVLGRSRESEIQHTKATGKGAADFVLTFQDQMQMQLPHTLKFEFEQRDQEGAMLDAQVAYQWALVARVLYREGEGVLSREQAASLLVERGIIPASWTTEIEELAVTTSEIFSDPLAVGIQAPPGPPTVSEGAAVSQAQTSPTQMRAGVLRNLREQAMEDAHVQRAIALYPRDAIVQYRWPENRMLTLWERGEDARRRSLWQIPTNF